MTKAALAVTFALSACQVEVGDVQPYASVGTELLDLAVVDDEIFYLTEENSTTLWSIRSFTSQPEIIATELNQSSRDLFVDDGSVYFLATDFDGDGVFRFDAATRDTTRVISSRSIERFAVSHGVVSAATARGIEFVDSQGTRSVTAAPGPSSSSERAFVADRGRVAYPSDGAVLEVDDLGFRIVENGEYPAQLAYAGDQLWWSTSFPHRIRGAAGDAHIERDFVWELTADKNPLTDLLVFLSVGDDGTVVKQLRPDLGDVRSLTPPLESVLHLAVTDDYLYLASFEGDIGRLER